MEDKRLVTITDELQRRKRKKDHNNKNEEAL
jgi:hypothetical protein